MSQNQPVDKTKNFMEEFQKGVFGITKEDALKKKICIKCKDKIVKFNDELSAKEYSMSALCQSCQDGIFSQCKAFERGD